MLWVSKQHQHLHHTESENFAQDLVGDQADGQAAPSALTLKHIPFYQQ